jgi:hypothetical protein
MKGGFSIESDATAQSFISGSSTMANSYISAYDTMNLIKTNSTLLPKVDMALKVISQGSILSPSREKPFDMNFQTIGTLVNGQWGAIPSSSSIWTIGWTRF